MNYDFGYYDDPFEVDNREASEFDELVLSLKKAIENSVKEEIQNKIMSLERKNEELQKYKDNYDSLIKEQRQKIFALDKDRKAFEKEKQNYSLQDLLKNCTLTAYKVERKVIYEEIEFYSPSGKKYMESNQKDVDFFIEELEAVKIYVQVNKNNPMRTYAYFSYPKITDGYTWFDSSRQVIFDTFEEWLNKTEGKYPRLFSSKEEAEKCKAFLEKDKAYKEQATN